MEQHIENAHLQFEFFGTIRYDVTDDRDNWKSKEVSDITEVVDDIKSCFVHNTIADIQVFHPNYF